MLAMCDLGHPMTSNLYQRDRTVQELLFRMVDPQVDRSTPGSRPGVQMRRPLPEPASHLGLRTGAGSHAGSTMNDVGIP
jgi:hypothetical protein